MDNFEIFKRNNLSSKEVNNLIHKYNDPNNKEDKEDMLKLIIGKFISTIEYNIKKKLNINKIDRDIKTDIISEIATKWIKKDNIENYNGYISSNIRYYTINYVNKNILYPELSERRMKDYIKLKSRKLYDKDKLNDKEENKLYNLELKIVKNTLSTMDDSECLQVKEIEQSEYRYKNVTDILNGDEMFLLNKYYTEKNTYKEIGEMVDKSKDTVMRRINKIKLKLEKEMSK